MKGLSFVTTKKITDEMVNDLYRLIASLETTEDCQLLFNDLCTFKEIEKMAQRIRAAKLLIEEKTYQQIIQETEISSATLSRISRCVQYGGGYTKFLSGSEVK